MSDDALFGEWITVKDACDLLGCTRQNVHKLIKSGKVTYKPPIYSSIGRDGKMDVASITQAIATVGFPIVACCGLFYLYDKTIKELTATITKIDATLTHIMDRLEGSSSNDS